MRVCHISKVTGVAGSERHLLLLLPGLQKSGLAVHLIVMEDPAHPPAQFYDALAKQQIPYTSIPIAAHFDVRAFWSLAKLLRTLAPDVVHTHLIHGDWYGIWAAMFAGVALRISTRHNDNPFRKNPLIRWINRQTMRLACCIIAISESVARFVEKVERVPVEKIEVIPYTMTPHVFPPHARATTRSRFTLEESEVAIGFVGRLIPQKGVDVLIDAFSSITAKGLSSRLVIVGDGHQREALEAQASHLGGRVQFAGWVNNAPSLLPGFDIVAMPSRWEGFGMVTLEAMNAQCPVVASEVSALPEIVHHEVTGLLVPPDDPEALAQALIRLIQNPSERKALGEAGYRRLLEEFSGDSMVQQTVALYHGMSA